MKPALTIENLTDPLTGAPAGGTCNGTGLWIIWQRGPMRTPEGLRPHTGAFVETVIEAALQRLRFYQTTQFACDENDQAIIKLCEALHWLHARTERRRAAGTEGTYEGA